MASGEIDVIPGRVLSDTELVDNQKLNDLGMPTLRIKELTITSRELADGTINADKLSVDLEAQLGVSDNSVTTNKIVDYAVTAAKVAAGMVVQFAYKQMVIAQTNTACPVGAGVPAATLGSFHDSIVFTPRFSSSLIYATVRIHCGQSSGTGNGGAALLTRSDDANAVAADGFTTETANRVAHMRLEYCALAGTTSPITFSLRYGPSSAAFYMYLGLTSTGNSAGGLFGPLMTIWEIKQ